jgi:hypothetical protein
MMMQKKRSSHHHGHHHRPGRTTERSGDNRGVFEHTQPEWGRFITKAEETYEDDDTSEPSTGYFSSDGRLAIIAEEEEREARLRKKRQSNYYHGDISSGDERVPNLPPPGYEDWRRMQKKGSRASRDRSSSSSNRSSMGEAAAAPPAFTDNQIDAFHAWRARGKSVHRQHQLCKASIMIPHYGENEAPLVLAEGEGGRGGSADRRGFNSMSALRATQQHSRSSGGNNYNGAQDAHAEYIGQRLRQGPSSSSSFNNGAGIWIAGDEEDEDAKDTIEPHKRPLPSRPVHNWRDHYQPPHQPRIGLADSRQHFYSSGDMAFS